MVALKRWILPAIAVAICGLYYSGLFTVGYFPPVYAQNHQAVDLARMSPANAIRLTYGVPRGMLLALPLKNGSTRLQRASVPLAAEPANLMALDAFFATFALLLAAYLVYRRPSVMMTALLGFVAGIVSITAIITNLARLPDVAFLGLTALPQAFFAIFPNFALASFAIRFPGSEPSPHRRIAIHVVDAIVLLALAFEIVRGLGVAWYAEPAITAYINVYLACAAVTTFAATASSVYFARRGERSRTAVVFTAIVLGGVLYAVAGFLETHAGIGNSHLAWLYNAAIGGVALAVAYAILKHRVFDIAFVLNRTLVFAVTSAVIVVVLVALEFAVERYLDALTRVEGLLLQFGIALFAALSVRAVHARVDRFVDTVFFRKRHEDEQAIRSFAGEAAYVTERETLLERTVQVLERHAGAAFADVVLDESDDPALVKLRAWHRVLDLHTIETQLRGELAYPMVARGRFVGALIVGPKRSQESYAPDESAAIEQLAHSVASSLDVMSVRDDGAHVTDALLALTQEIADLRRDLRPTGAP